MRIGIVCYPSLGGSGVVATELGHELADRGHDIHFISYERPFRLQEGKRIHFHEVGISKYDLFRYPDYALPLAVKMAQVAKEHTLDVFHVHYAIPHATSGYLAKQLLGEKAPKLITTLHGTDITLVGRDPSYQEIVRYSIEQSDVVTAVSHNLKEETLTHFGIKKEIHVIHNFFTPVHPLPPKSKEEKIVVHASNFRTVKRVGDVIEIFAGIRKKIPSRLLMIGTGKGIDEARQKTHERGLDDWVTFIGKTHDIDPHIASGDLFLLPSSQESFGLAALEAMAYGVPVVAANIGGLPEVIEQGVSGYLCKVGDTEAMTRCAIELLENGKEIAEGARKRAKEHFSAEKIIPLYEQLY